MILSPCAIEAMGDGVETVQMRSLVGGAPWVGGMADYRYRAMT